MVSCSLCGKTIGESNSIIDEVIAGKHHAFDNEYCLLMAAVKRIWKGVFYDRMLISKYGSS